MRRPLPPREGIFSPSSLEGVTLFLPSYTYHPPPYVEGVGGGGALTSLCFQVHFCVKWCSVFKGLGWLGFGIALGGCLGILLGGFNPDPDNARYLLSAMAQVIGTVFVLTIAVMQLISVSGKISPWGLFKRVEFWIPAIVTFCTISLALIFLYAWFFCIGVLVCLALGVGDLLAIGWSIVSMGTALAKPARLKALREEALQALSDRDLEVVVEKIKEAQAIGLGSF